MGCTEWLEAEDASRKKTGSQNSPGPLAHIRQNTINIPVADVASENTNPQSLCFDQPMISISVKDAADGSVLLSECNISRHNMLANLMCDLASARGVQKGQHGPGGGLQVEILHQGRAMTHADRKSACRERVSY